MGTESDRTVAALARRAVALQPAAEAFIQTCRLRLQPPEVLAADGRAILAAYQQLLVAASAVHPAPRAADELIVVLDQHVDLLTTVLDAVDGDPGRLDNRLLGAMAGLGRPAARLIVLRDRLRRAERIEDRPVSDVPTSSRF